MFTSLPGLDGGEIGGLRCSGQEALHFTRRCVGCRVPGHRVRELPATERPRERLAAYGAGAVSAAELLSVLWGSSEAAGKALARHGDLAQLAHADLLELTAVPGVGVSR